MIQVVLDRLDGMRQQSLERLRGICTGIAYHVEKDDTLSKVMTDDSADIVLST